MGLQGTQQLLSLEPKGNVDVLVLVKKDPLLVRMGTAEQVRELAQREFSLPGPDAVDLGCILSPSV